MGAGRALPPPGVRGDPRRGRPRLWTLGSYRDAGGAPAGLVHRPQAAPVAAALRHRPGGRGALGPGPRRARPRACSTRWASTASPRWRSKRDPRDGRDYLIEVNPRSWLWVGLATACGVNLPYAAWLRRGRARPPRWPPGHRSGLRWVLASQAPGGQRRARSAGASGPAGAFLHVAAARRSSDGVLDPRDPRPALALYARIAPPAPWLSCGSRVDGARPAFAPRARWVLETLAEAPRPPTRVWTDGAADLVYAPEPPAVGRLDPRRPRRPGLLRGRPAPSRPSAVHRSRGLTLLFPPAHPEGPIPGDLVASAFYLLARWDELRVPERDRFGRLPLAASAFGRIAGLDLEDPPVEGYLAALRARARHPAAPRVERRADPRHRPPAPPHRARAGRDRPPARAARPGRARWWARTPGTTCPTCWRPPGAAGVRSTVFLIGRNAHPLDGTPRARRTSASARRHGGRRAGRRRRGGPARGLRLVGGRRRPGRRARRPARRGRARSPACASTTCASATTRPCGGSSAPGAEYDSSLGFSEAPGFAGGHRAALPPLPGGRGAPGRACACCRSR